MAEMSLAEKIIRAESTEILRNMRQDMINALVKANVSNAADIVDRDYAILKDELAKRGAL